MTAVFHRNLRTIPPRAKGGDGCYIYDSDGQAYLDASGGAAVSCLGHGDRDIIAAIKQQLDEVAFAHTGFFTSDAAEALAETLLADAPDGLASVYFVSGGSEACEAALKLARQYFLETGEPTRRLFIARQQSYHGNTLGALAVGGNFARREPYMSILPEAHHIGPCYAYRGRRDDESEAAFALRAADELAEKIEALGPENVIAFIAEPVVGASLGAVAAAEGYFRRIREICDRYGILLILDEVMCGAGRTGSWFAFEQDDVVPDIVICAKGLGAGYQPIGAMIAHARIYDAVRDGSGAFQHGHTYMGHPTACAAALAVQKKIKDNDLLAQVRQRGAQLDAALHAQFGNHPHVGDIRGRGLFQAMEFVADRASKEAFAPSAKLHQRLKAAAMAEGLICYPGGGCVDGRIGDHVLLAPPYIISEAQIDELTAKLKRAFDTAIQQAMST